MPLSLSQHVRAVSSGVVVEDPFTGQSQAVQKVRAEETPRPVDQGGLEGGHVQERVVDPASKEYQERVDSLMNLRQRRLTGKGKDHE